MAYTLPTPAQLKTRFPEFADVDDDTIQPFIDAAGLWVDTRQWTESDYLYGAMYLAAHYLSMYQRALASGGAGGSSGGGSAGSDTLQTYLSNISFEDFKIQYRAPTGAAARQAAASGASSSSDSVFGLTTYGLLYIQLRRRNVVPFGVTGLLA